jgi:hypothetical protein
MFRTGKGKNKEESGGNMKQREKNQDLSSFSYAGRHV